MPVLQNHMFNSGHKRLWFFVKIVRLGNQPTRKHFVYFKEKYLLRIFMRNVNFCMVFTFNWAKNAADYFLDLPISCSSVVAALLAHTVLMKKTHRKSPDVMNEESRSAGKEFSLPIGKPSVT